MIEFLSVQKEARLLNPFKGFALETQVIEHRKDPLLNRWVIVLKGRMEYVKRYIESNEEQIALAAEETRQSCPFCPDAIEEKAPRFPDDLVPEGRIGVGEANCFPSLFAHQDFNAVVVLTRAHTLQLNEFTTPVLFNGLKAALTYVRTVFQRHSDVKHAAITMNFLPPAGSTIVHPHMQVIASHLPLAYSRQLEEASEQYMRLNNSSYWEDLIRVESKRRERHLAQRGHTHWITPYAPTGLNEIDGIVLDKPSLRSLTEDDLNDLAEGMRFTLKFYYERGIRSFNALLYSSTLDSESNAVSVGLKIVSRYGYKTRFVSDVWALQYLLNEQEVYDAPETICSEARPYFR